MKKAIVFSLMFLTLGIAAPATAEAKNTVAPSAEASEVQV